MTPLDAELGRLLAEARRVGGPDLPWHLHEGDGPAGIVFEIEADDAVLSTRLAAALRALSAREGLAPRWVVVRTEPPRFSSGPRIPDRGPPPDPLD